MAIKTFNAKNGVSVGTTPVDVIDSVGNHIGVLGTFSGVLKTTDTTAATTNTSGSIQAAGGISAQGAIWAGNGINSQSSVGSAKFTGKQTGATFSSSNPVFDGITDNTAAGVNFLIGATRTGDTVRRWYVDMDGKQFWSTGASAADAVLYRSATGVLKTDTAFSVGTNLTTGANSTITPSSGTLSIAAATGSDLILSPGSAGVVRITGDTRGFTDNTYFAWDSAGSDRLGFTKKVSFSPKLTHGSGTVFTIARSSGTSIAAAGTFTDEFTISTTGAFTLSGLVGINTAPTTTSALTLSAGTTGVSSLNIGHGSAPTTPVNGDIWTTTSGLFTRINGATQQLSATSATVASITGTANQVLANGTSGSATTGAVTLTLPQSIATTSAPQFVRLGIGTGASATAGLVANLSGNSVPAASWVSGANSNIRFYSEGTSGNSDIVFANASDTSTARSVLIHKRARGTLAAPTTMVDGDLAVAYIASVYDGSSFLNNASIEMYSAGPISTGVLPMEISFQVADQGARVTAAKFNSNGRFVAGGTTVKSIAAWGTIGAVFHTSGIQITDNSTLASTTVPNAVMASFGSPTFNASNTAITISTGATVYIADAPINGANVTITNPWALYVNSGRSRFGGLIQLQPGTTTDASMRIQHGVAPTSPQNGDTWTTSVGGLFTQVNGVTRNFVDLNSAQTLSSKTLTSPVIAAITSPGDITLTTGATNSIFLIPGSTSGAVFVGNASATSNVLKFQTGSAIIDTNNSPLSLKRSGGAAASALGFYDASNTEVGRIGGVTGTLQITNGGGGTTWAAFSSSSLTLGSGLALSVPITTDSGSSVTGAITTAGGIGVAKNLYVGGAVNIFPASGTAATLIQTAVGAADSIHILNRDAGRSSIISMRTAGSVRWDLTASAGAESGSNVGSDFVLKAYDDTGVLISNVLTIPRAAASPITSVRIIKVTDSTASTSTITGSILTSGGLGVAGAAFIGGNITSNGTNIGISSAAGADRNYYVLSSNSARWLMGGDGTAESGGNAGTNFQIRGYSDTAVLSATARMTMNRNTGDTALFSTTDSTTSLTGGLTLAGGLGVAKSLYVGGTRLNLTAAGVQAILSVNTTGAADPLLLINSDTGRTRRLQWATGGLARWEFATRSNAESGSNAGSDFQFNAYDDAGTLIDTPISIGRSAGSAVSIARPFNTAYSPTAFAAGTVNLAIIGSTSGGDVGGTTSLRPLSINTNLNGANNVSGLIGIVVQPQISGTAGAVSTYNGVNVFHNQTNAMTASGVNFFLANGQITGAGGITSSLSYFQANALTISSTGDVSGTIVGFGTSNIGRATASTVYAFSAADMTVGTTRSAAFRGAVLAGTNKYNLYLDGSAQNYILGLTGIGTVPTATSQLSLVASTTAVSSLNIAQGAAPTTPVNGDVWTTGSGFFTRINSSTWAMARNDSSQTFAGTQTFSGPIVGTDTTNSTTSTTGAIKTAGGLGVALDTVLGGTLGVVNRMTIGTGNQSLSAWGSTGPILNSPTRIFTDSSTAVSGTVAAAAFVTFQAPTLAASNATVTTTVASTVKIVGTPTAGTNQTITNAFGLETTGNTLLGNGNTAKVRIGANAGQVTASPAVLAIDPFGWNFDSSQRINPATNAILQQTGFYSGNDASPTATRADFNLVSIVYGGGGLTSTNPMTYTDAAMFAVGAVGGGGSSTEFPVGTVGNLTITNAWGIYNAYDLRNDGAVRFGGLARSRAAWTTTGVAFSVRATTYTDTSTAISGTAATAVFTSLAIPVLAATNATVTTTDAATFYVAGGPSNGTNNTITNAWGIWSAGKIRADDLVSLSASTTVRASIRIAHGAAPTSPVNGDFWSTTAGFFGRINTSTQQFATLGFNQTWSGTQTFTPGISSPKLTNLTTNGFVKTGSSDGTLSVDTTNYTSKDSTFLGFTGNMTSDAVTNTAALWSALPVGYSRFMNSSIGSAGGAPAGIFGYFTKVANRDSSGGWAGLWINHANPGQNYFGIAVDSTVTATWDRIWSSLYLGQFTTGLVKSTTTTGVPSIAVAGTDYVAPSAYASVNGHTMSTARILGRTTAATGAAEEITIGTGLSMVAGVLTATAGGGGTVTGTAGNLTANAVVLGAGSLDTKVVVGITTDGASALNLGVAGSSVGSVVFSNATSGAITLAPVTGALGTVTVSIPAATTTLAGLAISQTFTGVNTFSPTARSSGAVPYLTVQIPTDTAQTAATESIGYRHSTATRTWATTGTVALQRERYLAGPTYASAAASQTFTDVFNLYLDPPLQGTNAIFTRRHTLGIVDSTSATSSITGGLVISTTLGTTGTSVGIGAGNINAGAAITAGGTLNVTGLSTLGQVSLTGGATNTALTIAQTARTSGILPYIKYTIPADTGQTASTESPGIVGVTGTRTWATTGTVALQREIFFPGPTYASASASQTFTDVFNLYLTPPVQGANAIFTRGHTLGIVDATSAVSSITGAVVIATTLGTVATSIGFGGGNINAGGNIVAGGTISSPTLSGTNTGDQVITLTGDVTGTGTNTFAASVTWVNAPTMVGDTGAGGAKGMVPAPAAGDAVAGKALMADGSWVGTNVCRTVVLTAGATLSASNHFVVANSVGGFTLVVPAASAHTGRTFIFKNKNTGTIILDATGNGTIDGANTYNLTSTNSLTIISDGSRWNIV